MRALAILSGFAIGFAALNGWAITSSDFTSSGSDLHDATKAKIFFDPHNHTGGILPPLAIIDAKKFIAGERITEEDLKDFWTKLVPFFNTTLMKSPRISLGTKLVVTCNEPSLYCSADANDANANTKKCHSSLLDNIYNMLSATPLTSFNTSYSIRGNTWQIPDLAGASGGSLSTQAKIYELALTGAGVVELSEAFIGDKKEEDATRTFTKYQSILDDLRRPNTSPKNQLLKQRLAEKNLAIPSVKWLLLTHTMELGKLPNERTLTYDDGQCLSKEMPPTLNTDPMADLYQTLVNYEDAVGVDVAGPEYTCFTNEGMKDFKELVDATYKASQVRRQNNGKFNKLIVRIHVGEGAPLVDTKYVRDQAGACEEAKKFPVILKDPETGLYKHQVEARRNIGVLITAIRDLIRKYPDINEYVVFRLGHVTHLTKELASRMKSFNITADVNLSSNIATQAWTVDKEIIDEYLVNKGVTANQVRDLRRALERNGASPGKIFDGHGLKWLLYYRVPTILGTDGSGVEHSNSLAGEYELAEKLIDHWNQTDDEFKGRNVTIDTLLKNQALHFDAMGYGK